MSYEYKTAQIPANIHSKNDNAAAGALQTVIDREAVDGWEFYRTDSFSTMKPQGCLGIGQPLVLAHNVATFRRAMPV